MDDEFLEAARKDERDYIEASRGDRSHRLYMVLIFAVMAIALWKAFGPASAAEPISVRVIDADTFDIGLDENVRLHGWDGPEKGKRADCDAERELHKLAKAYAEQIILNATSIEPVIDESLRCGYGRYCGDLLLDGRRYSADMEAAGYLKTLNRLARLPLLFWY